MRTFISQIKEIIAETVALGTYNIGISMKVFLLKIRLQRLEHKLQKLKY